MAHNVEETLEALKEENLELKLDAITKEMRANKTDAHRHMDLIIERIEEKLARIDSKVSKTNGSVALAMEKINLLEREDNKRKIDDLYKKLEETNKKTKFWTTISSNKWVAALIATVVYMFAIQEVREAFFEFLKVFK